MHHFGTRKLDILTSSLHQEIERLEQLAADMTFIGTAPFPAEQVIAKLCAKSPILEDWRLAARLVPCLVGNASGHPVLKGENRHIATSEIFMLSDELNCARSSSRWYRLGRPADGQAKDM